MTHARHLVVLSGALLALTASACGGGGGGGSNDGRRNPVVFTGKGTEVPEIVEEFRARLGRDNGGVPERGFTGRREIDWDAIPDENATPAFLPPDFFNSRSDPLARGIRITSPGNGVQVSADADNANATPVRFGNFGATYPLNFRTFSAERLFAPIGSTIVDLAFAIPGSPDQPALTRGFGAVFTDVEGGGSKIELFAENDTSLGDYFVPTDAAGLSFLGVLFDDPVVKRVRITCGNEPLGPLEVDDLDVVALDDFIYGEPQPQD
ncbi:MAG: hypothetical protein IT294_14140 [Deltaproteobacteria bacterium]|nr:hypothetical protein [Deltaproteobacteria bacterium]